MVEKLKRKTIKIIESEFKDKFITLITAAFGFVAALSWNEAIKSFIQTVIPVQDQWPYLMLNALIITLIAVIVIFFISRISR